MMQVEGPLAERREVWGSGDEPATILTTCSRTISCELQSPENVGIRGGPSNSNLPRFEERPGLNAPNVIVRP